MSKTDRLVFEYLAKNPNATARELAAEIGKSTKTVYRSIRTLRERGLISRKGGDYNGSWIIED